MIPVDSPSQITDKVNNKPKCADPPFQVEVKEEIGHVMTCNMVVMEKHVNKFAIKNNHF